LASANIMLYARIRADIRTYQDITGLSVGI
jgi:hypothetical protein